MIVSRSLLRALLSSAALLALGACTTMGGYAGRYRQLGDATGPGIMPAAQLVSTLDASHGDRVLIVGSEELAATHARCLYFRNQLVIAAEQARLEIGAEASSVQAAAERMERAYQTSDEAFVATCARELDTPLGKVFAAEMAAAGIE